jgi:hypothetical protein
MYSVYLITCRHPSYGLHVMPYVGVVLADGKTVADRFYEHLSGDKASGATYLRNAIKKHGKEWFTVEQIDAGNTPEQALELEQRWVGLLGAKRPTGYNLNDGGQGNTGFRFTDEQRAYLSSVKQGIIPANIHELHEGNRGNNYALGKRWKRSAESNAKLRGNPQAKVAGHTRWHVNKGIRKEGCELCLTA